MAALPKKLKRPKMGVDKGPKREWPKHQRFVRRHACIVPGCQKGPIVFAHVRSAANAGKDLKPFDWFGVSMCWEHHDEQHKKGAETFMAKYHVDLWALAAEFARRSTDLAMREYMQEIGA